jgi:hypothetical protein
MSESIINYNQNAALGSQADFAGRMAQLVPQGWYPEQSEAPVINALYNATGNLHSFNFSQNAYIMLQQRLGTMTDVNLDIFAFDYFGPSGLVRQSGQNDTQYLNRIDNSLLAPKNTIPALTQAVGGLTGYDPLFFEPFNGASTGYYNVNGTVAYNVSNVGAYGSLSLPGQFFITVFLPIETGIPNVAGYYNPSLSFTMPGGYGVGAIEYAQLSQTISDVTDARVYSLIANTKAAGTIAWVKLISYVDSVGYANPYGIQDSLITSTGRTLTTQSGQTIIYAQDLVNTEAVTDWDEGGTWDSGLDWDIA